MLTRDDLTREFSGVENITPSIYFCPVKLANSTICNYIKISGDDGLDFLLVSSNLRDDEFAQNTFQSIPKKIDLKKLTVVTIGKNKYGFSGLLLAPPLYHVRLKGIYEKERENLIWCVPFHECEFTGDESKEEFRKMYTETVPALEWGRLASPKIKIYFDNPKTKGGTVNKNPVIFKYDSLMNEIRKLNGVEKGFLEITNFKGRVVEIVSPRENEYFFLVNRDDKSRVLMTQPEVMSAVSQFLAK